MRSLLLAPLCLVACFSMQKQERLSLLNDSIEAYNHAYMWKNYERASMYRLADVRPAFLAAHEEEVDSLQVDDFQIVQVNVLSDKAATVTVKFRYMKMPSTVVKTQKVVQHWAEVDGNWLIEQEDDPLRELDLDKKPTDPRNDPTAAGAKKGEPGDTEVESEGPGDFLGPDDD